MAERIGKRTVSLKNGVALRSFAAAVGPKEAEGPLATWFDVRSEDEFLGEDSFEKAESRLQQLAVTTALKKAGLESADIDLIFAGDLLNQCIGSAYGLRDFEIPFVGLYGACSTMALSLIMASMSVESGVADRAVAVTSSHFCSSERQFRFPLEYGGQRPPTAQWTVTGSGAVVVERCDDRSDPMILVKAFTVGKIVDLKVTDMNNMGAAMAPAAADTVAAFLTDTGTRPQDYDLIVTGDLGMVGSKLLLKLLSEQGTDLKNHNDCGLMIFDCERQDVHAGGSGCGCSASVLCSYILQKMTLGELKSVLFCATGALMSPTSSMQGESIPAIAHLVHLSSEK
ncbi:MAG: stage V sporulation protein AD [Clostridia bacterium]|nr:stage V sporulation protein AD [Clostridia bacterium]